MKTESIFRVDKFAVPAQSRDAFMARLQVTHKTLGAADGCVQNLVLEQVSGAGEFNVVTIVEWRDTVAYENARQAAQQRQRENGFDPQSYFREMGIKADLGNYAPMHE
jgi:quinol monooxygenase YgiN